MKKTLFAALLVVTLTACAPAPPTTDIQSTAIAIVQTDVALTQTALPTATPTFTPTATIVVYPSPSPIPTFPPPPILTPDAIQVERWQEYQKELAKALFSFDPEHPEGYSPEVYKDALCEWDILGRSNEEVYVFAVCISNDSLWLPANPAIIYLKSDSSVREVVSVRASIDRRTQLEIYDLRLYPIDVQKKLCLYYFGWAQCDAIIPGYFSPRSLQPRENELILHLKYRRSHAEESPLVILLTIPTATPMP